MWRPCCKTYRRFLHKKERGLPAFRWQTSWRRWRDSNSRAGFEPTYRISSADPSTAWVHLQIYVISLVPTRRPIQPVEIGKNNRIEQTPIHNLNLPANPHGYWLFGSLDFQSGNMISSLLCNCDGGVRLGVVSVSPVPAESRLKSGFFAWKALRDGLFWKWVQIGIFPDFGEKCGKIGEKNRETAIHRRIELPTDENLFLRCYKWMYSPLTGTAFPR